MVIYLSSLENAQYLDIVALICTISAILSVPLYIFLLIIVFNGRKTHFLGSFYTFFLVLGTIDIVATLNNFIGNNLSAWGVTSSFAIAINPWYGRIYLAISWLARVNQGTSSVLIAINRATCTLWPLKYHKIWMPHRLKYFILIQILPGASFFAVVMFYRVEIIYATKPRPLRRMSFNFLDVEWRAMLFNFAAFLEVIFVAIIITSYIITIKTIMNKNKALQKVNGRGETAATYLGTCITLMELAYFAYAFLAVFFTIPTLTYFSIHSVFNDFYSTLNCYLLLLFSTGVRQKFLNHLGVKRSATTIIAQQVTAVSTY